MLVMSHHHTAVQLANCSILQDQRQSSSSCRSSCRSSSSPSSQSVVIRGIPRDGVVGLVVVVVAAVAVVVVAILHARDLPLL